MLLPANAVLEGVLDVNPGSLLERKSVIQGGAFALVTPFLDEYRIGKGEELVLPDLLPPYLFFVRYRAPRWGREVLESLHEKPFQAAWLGRLLDLCREHPKKRFGRQIVFLGSYYSLEPSRLTGYPCLRETINEGRVLCSIFDRMKFGEECCFALQPTSYEAVQGLIPRRMRLEVPT